MPKARRLILKHGTKALINESSVKMFIDKHKSSDIKKPNNKVIPYVKTKSVLTLSQIPLNAQITLLGKEYRVWEQTEEIYDRDKLQFCATTIFEDEFVNGIQLFEQNLSSAGCNLPEHTPEPFLTTKAQIRTQSIKDVLERPLVTDKVVTHVFSIFFVEGVEKANLLVWNNRHFEVLGTENINEKDRILEIVCAEVLS